MDLLWLGFLSIPFIIILVTLIRRLTLKRRRKSRQLTIINRYRRKRHLHPLKAYYALDKIAKSHSYYMAKYRVCNHDGFEERAHKVKNLTGGSVGENCYQYPAQRYNTKIAIKLVNGWMKSPGHRANLLNPDFKKIGVGVVSRKGYIYATQIFSS